ncbi:MAG: FAD-binding oxidoreductase, partial [Hyphomicrobiales bacterium]|nr:FAD-binding oxidoreductase [Hyphomicrobiales bacterium]
MTMYETETLIVGGGLMGCWTALFLAQMDREVTVLEKGYIGAQASGVNYGNLRIQGRHPGQLPLSLRAQEIWERFEEITGEDCEIAQCGHLYVAHCDEQAAKLEIYATEARAHGLDVEQLKREDVFARWPWFGSNVIAANFSGRDGCANPRLSTPAVARAAVRAGAQIVEQTHCIATRKEGSDFRITTDTDDTYQAHNLVNAAGAWANIIAEAFGERAPMFAAGPPQFVTEPLPPFIAPSVQSVDGQVIFRQVARGNVVVAGYPRGPSDIVL